MNTEELERLLEDNKGDMMEKCPAYRLDCAICAALSDILSGWSDSFGPAFRAYEALLRREGLEGCLENYLLNKQMCTEAAGDGPDPELPAMTLQEDLMAETGWSSETAATYRQLKQAAGLEEGALGEFLELYERVQADKNDFEEMFSCTLGARDADICKKVWDWVTGVVGPDKQYGISW